MMEMRDLLERSPAFTRVVTAPSRAVCWLLQRTFGRLFCYFAGHGPVTRTHTPSSASSESDCLTCGKHEEMEAEDV